jgi:hypothetical protein
VHYEKRATGTKTPYELVLAEAIWKVIQTTPEYKWTFWEHAKHVTAELKLNISPIHEETGNRYNGDTSVRVANITEHLRTLAGSPCFRFATSGDENSTLHVHYTLIASKK